MHFKSLTSTTHVSKPLCMNHTNSILIPISFNLSLKTRYNFIKNIKSKYTGTNVRMSSWLHLHWNVVHATLLLLLIFMNNIDYISIHMINVHLFTTDDNDATLLLLTLTSSSSSSSFRQTLHMLDSTDKVAWDDNRNKKMREKHFFTATAYWRW